jgi:glutathione S-transferase
MRLFVCYGTWRAAPRPGGHPCGRAYWALKEAGYEPEVVKSYGLGILPKIFNLTSGRREVEKLTGNRFVPTLVLDDGTVIDGSEEIVRWAQEHPAAAKEQASAGA